MTRAKELAKVVPCGIAIGSRTYIRGGWLNQEITDNELRILAAELNAALSAALTRAEQEGEARGFANHKLATVAFFRQKAALADGNVRDIFNEWADMIGGIKREQE